MMKLFFKITALALCLAMLAVIAAGCAKETDPAKIVVATVNGENLYRSELDERYAQTLYMYQQYGMPVDESSKDQVTEIKNSLLDQMIKDKVIELKAKELGFDKLTNEQIDEQKKAVDDFIKGYKDQIRASITASSPSATASPAPSASTPPANIDQQVEDQWRAMLQQGNTTEDKLREELLQQYLDSAKIKNLEDSITNQITVSDDEIKKYYDDNVKTQTEELKTNPAQYETHQSSDIAFVVPAGIVKVKQILIKVADDKSTTAQGLYNEGKTEDAFAVLANEFARIQPKSDEALAKVKAGEDFDKLIDQYNEDPGMKSEPYKTEGYTVVPGTSQYLKEFTDAALTLKNLGDTSGLVKTVFGYHILKNVGTITPGPVALDTVKDKVKEKLLGDKKSAEITKQEDAWKSAAKIQTFKEKMFVEVKAPATSAPASSAPAASPSAS